MIVSELQPDRGYKLKVQGLKTLPEQLLRAAGTGLARGLLITVGVAQTEFLQGPRPARLGEITGRLRNAMWSEVKVNKESVTGRIGNNVRYAAFHEFGFHGTQHVSSYNRVLSITNKAGDTVGGRTAFGQFIANGGKRAAKGKNVASVGFETVKAHTRKIDYAGRPFTMPALQKCLPIILGEINKEMSATQPGGSHA